MTADNGDREFTLTSIISFLRKRREWKCLDSHQYSGSSQLSLDRVSNGLPSQDPTNANYKVIPLSVLGRMNPNPLSAS